MFHLLCLLFFALLQEFKVKVDSKILDYNLNLPPEHMAYYFTSHQKVAEACQMSPDCPYKVCFYTLLFSP